ncbi:MAG: SMC-Scp complex subunit ScpB [Pseudomonadota bacterium]
MDGHSFSRDDETEERSVREAQAAIAEAFGREFVAEAAAADEDEPENAGELQPLDAPVEIEAADPAAEEGGADSDDRLEIDAPAVDGFAAPTGEAFDDLEEVARQALGRALHVRMVEALIFAASEPLDAATLKAHMPNDADIDECLEALRVRYESAGVRLVEIDGRWTFRTAPDLAHLLERHREQPKKLSRAATETLAIIAYHQPCTRADIEDVRGVAVSKGSLDILLEIGWIAQHGRRDAPGRPALYVTTPEFLSHFNLASVGDLPGLADLKAAGLLDGRLPPGFTVPTPQDAAPAEGEEERQGEFLSEFVEEDAEATSETPPESDGGVV